MPKVSNRKRAEKKIDHEVSKARVCFDEKTIAFFRSELDIDIIEEYERLKAVGKIPMDKLMDRVALTKEINNSAENARQANKIFLKAKAEREYFRMEYNKKLRVLSHKATEVLEEWKKENKYSKQITQDMIKQELSSNDELSGDYRELIEKQEELRAIKADCQVLADEWSQRKWSLRTQASLVAAEKEVSLPKLNEK